MDFKGIFFNLKDFSITNKKLGKGSFGSVYIAENLISHSIFAAKIIKINDNFDEDNQMLIMRESTIIAKLNHPSIIKFYGINFRSLKDPQKYQPTILTEYLPNGSLFEMLEKERKGNADREWTPTKKYICLIGISCAMKYLHEQGILHRDLKPENVILDSNYYPKVCDFGLAKFFPLSLTSSVQLSISGQFGTALYMAPELINSEKIGPGIDVFAFSILAYEVFTEKPPYYELGIANTFVLWKEVEKGVRPTFTNDIPQKTKDLISRCWDHDIKKRPSFNEIFEKLSTDFTYSPEEVDDDEIKYYLEMIESQNVNDDSVEFNRIINNSLDIFRNQFLKFKSANEYLHFACEIENVQLVKFILSNKSVDINSKKSYSDQKRKYERTALHIASEKGNLEIVKILLNDPKINCNIVLREKLYDKKYYYEII